MNIRKKINLFGIEFSFVPFAGGLGSYKKASLCNLEEDFSFSYRSGSDPLSHFDVLATQSV